MDEQEVRITATLVPEDKRLAFLPGKLPNDYLRFEQTTYAVLQHQAAEYHGGEWAFYELSNGGLYMAPKDYETLELVVPGNGYKGSMLGDAAGIVASLVSLNSLCWRTPSERLNALFYQLRDFACEHVEAPAILGAID